MCLWFVSQSIFLLSAKCCVPVVCEPVNIFSKCHMLCACGLWASPHVFKVPNVVCLWFVSQSSCLQSAKCCVPVVCEPVIISSKCQMLCACGLKRTMEAAQEWCTTCNQRQTGTLWWRRVVLHRTSLSLTWSISLRELIILNLYNYLKVDWWGGEWLDDSRLERLDPPSYQGGEWVGKVGRVVAVIDLVSFTAWVTVIIINV